MSVEIPVTSESTLPQRLRSSAAYATQVKHDWEHKSFERFFEAGRKPREQLDRQSVPPPSWAEVASRNSEFEGSEAVGRTAVALAEDEFGLSSETDATIGSPSRGIDRSLDPGNTLEEALHVQFLSDGSGEGHAPVVGESWRAEASSLTRTMASGTSSRAAAAVPAASALVVKLTEKAATVSLRDAHIDVADIDRLRFAIASELGWTGLSLASFKVNGEEFQPFERQTTSAQADVRRQPSGKTLFRISDGETESWP